tara:strand:+ start:344 stop:643 length:300 start_codon:yes stop_codon:yes gene_type:complete
MSYFKVGEECVLQSNRYPDLNGDCVVIEVLKPKTRILVLGDGQNRYVNTCAYRTTIENNERVAWAEVSLRKKHKPSTKSLSSMIEELNIKSKVESKYYE